MNLDSHRLARILLLAVLVVMPGSGHTLSAQSANAIRGFSAAQAEEERAWEEKMRAIPQPSLLREYMAKLSAEPHHLGSPGCKAVAE